MHTVTEVIISHKDLYIWLSGVLSKIDKKKLTNAFLYSLSTRDLSYRPHLSCFVFASSIPVHDLEKTTYPSGHTACTFCGHCDSYPNDVFFQDLELKKWGGVRIADVFTATYYLDKFLKMESVIPEKKDFDIFNNIIDTILLTDSGAKPRDIEKIFSKIFKSNKGERETLINQLGVIGILETDNYKGFHTKYTHPNFRAIPAVSKIDWNFPVCWWRGKDKISIDNYNFFFNEYAELRRE